MRFPGFVGPSYLSQSPNAECEDTINLFLERIETDEGKNAYVMYKRPGYRLFASPLGIIITSLCPTIQPVLGEAYSYIFIARTDNTPVTWTASGLPSGLSINSSTGEVSGTPTESGLFPYTITATDSLGHPNTLHCSFVIAVAPLEITSACPTDELVLDEAYASDPFTATGGTEPYVWTVTGLETTGLTMDEDTGIISGTPILAGTFPYTGTVTSEDGQVAHLDCEYVIDEPATCTPYTELLATKYQYNTSEMVKVGDYLYVIAFNDDDQTYDLLKLLAEDASLVATLVLGDDTLELDGLITDGITYLFAVGTSTDDDTIWAYRILLSDFSTFVSLNLADTGQTYNLTQDGVYIYILPTFNDADGHTNGLVIRVQIADWTTNSRLSFIDSNPTWSKEQVGIRLDASYIYVAWALSGGAGATNEKMELVRLNRSAFTYNSTLLIDTGGSSGLPLRPLNGCLTQDATNLFVSFGDNTPDVWLAKITTASFAVDTLHNYGGIEAFTWSIDPEGGFLYLVTNGQPSHLVKIETADLTNFEWMTLDGTQGQPFVKDGDEFYVGLKRNVAGDDNIGRVQHICEFVPIT